MSKRTSEINHNRLRSNSQPMNTSYSKRIRKSVRFANNFQPKVDETTYENRNEKYWRELATQLEMEIQEQDKSLRDLQRENSILREMAMLYKEKVYALYNLLRSNFI